MSSKRRLTAEDRRLRAISEEDWRATVEQIAALHRWLAYHPPRAGIRRNGSVRTTTPGFPDLTLVRGPRLVFVELKAETGRTSEAQDAWLAALAAASTEVYVFRPSDLDEVRDVLGRSA
jgi:hypothetical protein